MRRVLTHPIIGRLFILLIKLLRLIDRTQIADLTGRVMRMIGPLRKEHQIGRENLMAAFPEKPAAEIEAILSNVWDNLGRVAAEFVHLDRLHILDPSQPGAQDVVYDQESYDLFHRLRTDNRPALIFAAHLANWEVLSYVAAAYQLPMHILYRPPNIGSIDDVVREMRADQWVTPVRAGLDAPLNLLRALEAGGHVGMLVDQHYRRGVYVVFFGRRCKANPLIARLASRIECPIHGTRVVRLPQANRFRVEITDEIAPVRDTHGKINVEGTMQVITSVVEGWAREHPEQWLWVHRRWR